MVCRAFQIPNITVGQFALGNKPFPTLQHATTVVLAVPVPTLQIFLMALAPLAAVLNKGY